MIRKNNRGATRKPVRKLRQPIAWQQWFRNAFVFLIFAGFVSGGILLNQEDTLPILHVTVEGDFVHANQHALVKAVTPFVKGSFLSVDVANIRKAGEALPWIKQIQVRRIWPDSLHLIVEEQTAIARWNHDALVSEHGEIFTPPATTIPTGLLKLYGPEGSHQLMARRIVGIQQQLSSASLEVAELRLDNRRAWKISFTNDMQLLLGRADNNQRLQRFIDIYKAGLQQFETNIAAVDMRYTNGLSVVWKQGQKPDFNGTV